MQADRFTIKSQEAIAAAREIAAARRNPQVGPNHLLLALLEQQDTLVVPILARLGADIEAVRRNANEAIELMPAVTGEAAAEPQYDDELIATLRRAVSESEKLKDEFVPSEVLLVALAEDRNTDVGATREQVLEAVGELRPNPVRS